MNADLDANLVYMLELSLSYVQPDDLVLLRRHHIFPNEQGKYFILVFAPAEPNEALWAETRLLGFSVSFLNAMRAACDWFDDHARIDDHRSTRWVKFDAFAPETPSLPKP